MKKHINGFKEFALKGNVFDLAVGIIIGSAFGKIVTSLVNDLLMPLISLLLGNVSFQDLKVILKVATETETEVAILYGNFIQTTLDFIIIALSIYFIVKLLTKFKKKEEVIINEPIEDTLSVLKDIRNTLIK